MRNSVRAPAALVWQVGRRLTGVTLLTGSVVRIWDGLERVLARHELELSRSDRVMRIVRVDFGGGALPLIGAACSGSGRLRARHSTRGTLWGCQRRVLWGCCVHQGSAQLPW